MHTILKVLRRPWILHPGYWVSSLLISLYFGVVTIEDFLIAQDGVINAAILARVFAVNTILALFIQLPILLTICVFLSRIKSRLGSLRFGIVFIILVLISLSIGVGKGELKHPPSVDFFMASLIFLALCSAAWPVASWLFGAANTKSTIGQTNSIPNLDNTFASKNVVDKSGRAFWMVLIAFLTVSIGILSLEIILGK